MMIFSSRAGHFNELDLIKSQTNDDQYEIIHIGEVHRAAMTVLSTMEFEFNRYAFKSVT